jgi:type IV pilus assembly protein PilA
MKGETLMFNKLRSKKGFTLIELLIVVAIIGILAAIAIPQFSAYRAKAYNSAANSDLKNIKTGMEAYMADNQEYPVEVDYK